MKSLLAQQLTKILFQNRMEGINDDQNSEPKSLKEDTTEITDAYVHGSTLVSYKAM